MPSTIIYPSAIFPTTGRRHAVLIFLMVLGLLLAIGWFIGRRLTILWTSRQRENELSAATEREFLDLYGEFFALWKLWNYFTRDIGAEKLAGLSRAALLDRACQAEGVSNLSSSGSLPAAYCPPPTGSATAVGVSLPIANCYLLLPHDQ